MRLWILILTGISVTFVAHESNAAVTGTVRDNHFQKVTGAVIRFIDESAPGNVHENVTDEFGQYAIDLTPLSVTDEIPAPFSLGQNYPNPFNPATTIPFSLSTDGRVTLAVYSITGQLVRTLADGILDAGAHTAVWDGRDESGNSAGAGIYLYRLKNGGFSETRRMLLLDGGSTATGGVSGLASAHDFSAGGPAAKITLSSTYTVTITHEDIVPYVETGVTVSDGAVLDFTVKLKEVVLPQGLTLVALPGGDFRMGDSHGVGSPSEIPVHDVRLSPFEMSAFEITNAQYAVFLNDVLAAGGITAANNLVTGTTGDYAGQVYYIYGQEYSDLRYSGNTFSVSPGRDSHPVFDVTWFGAMTFALHYGLDLPTEAEWEYACGAGTETLFYTGDAINGDRSSDLDKAGWYANNSDTGGEYPWTHPVGMKTANAFGLYDMHGNLWEWCGDWLAPYPSYRVIDPTGTDDGIFKVIRGGGWQEPALNCRTAHREGVGAEHGTSFIGFRVVRRQ